MTEEHDRIERLLKNVRPAEPSAELRERAIEAARHAWRETPAEIPWRIALGRLAAAAVAAVLIVSCADYLSDRAIAPWQPKGPVATNVRSYSIDEFPEVSFGPFPRHVAAVYRPAGYEMVGMLGYRERIQEALAETDPGGPPETLTPGKGRSRLLPARPGFPCCS